MSSSRPKLSSCPSCGSEAIVVGDSCGRIRRRTRREILSLWHQVLHSKRSVRLVGEVSRFEHVRSAGHVWNTLDATDLRELIEAKGTDDLRTKLSGRSRQRTLSQSVRLPTRLKRTCGKAQGWLEPSHESERQKVRPNPSLERTSTGLALGPRTGQCHHPLRGPSANPVGSAQLKR